MTKQAKPKPTPVYRQRLVVRICGRVPFDMFRYDSCCPATGEDAAKLANAGRDGFYGGDDAVEVTLNRFSMNGAAPEIARWASFGCRVVSWEPIR